MGEKKRMRRAKKPTKNDGVQARALVNRQVLAWEKHDFAIAAADWLPNGHLFFPGGHRIELPGNHNGSARIISADRDLHCRQSRPINKSDFLFR